MVKNSNNTASSSSSTSNIVGVGVGVSQIKETKYLIVQQCCNAVEEELLRNSSDLQALPHRKNSKNNNDGDEDSDDGTTKNEKEDEIEAEQTTLAEPFFVQQIRRHHEEFLKKDIDDECHDFSAIRSDSSSPSCNTSIDWNTIPSSLTPEGGALKGNRAISKRKQIQALMDKILPLVDMLLHHNRKKKQHKQATSNDNDSSNEDDDTGSRIRVVDIGAGSGHVGLVLAWMRPTTTHVTLLERKEYSCRQAVQRAEQANLHNVKVANTSLHGFCNYDYNPQHDEQEQEKIYDNQQQESQQPEEQATTTTSTTTATTNPRSRFDLAISLHSCGVLTDAALEMCIQNRAAFCLVPCCYGQTSSNDLLRPHMPRSCTLSALRGGGDDNDFKLTVKLPTPPTDPTDEQQQQNRGRKPFFKTNNNETIITNPFMLVAKSADCSSAVNPTTSFVETKNFQIAKKCMQLVDADRIEWMTEYEYSGIITSLMPLHLTPKNNIIMGIPKETFTTTDTEESIQQQHTQKAIKYLALKASAKENYESEQGEKREEREKIRAAHANWKEQFQNALTVSGSAASS